MSMGTSTTAGQTAGFAETALTAQAMRMLLGALSPAGARAGLQILFFHRVLAEPDPLLPDVHDARRFEETMQWVRQWFTVLPLPEAVERLTARSLPARALVITFDDGYADNEAVALPILRRLGLPATFFVSTAYLDGGGLMWNDVVLEAIRHCRGESVDLGRAGFGVHSLGLASQRRALVDSLIRQLMHLPGAQRAERVAAIAHAAGGCPGQQLMMTSQQVRQLHAAGMTIGGHTATHPILARQEPAAARRDIAEGKDRLEALIGDRLEVFAYPSGRPGRDYAAEHVEMVKACGFKAAVSTAIGTARAGADCWQLPRLAPWDRQAWRFGLHMMQNLRRTRYLTV